MHSYLGHGAPAQRHFGPLSQQQQLYNQEQLDQPVPGNFSQDFCSYGGRQAQRAAPHQQQQQQPARDQQNFPPRPGIGGYGHINYTTEQDFGVPLLMMNNPST